MKKGTKKTAKKEKKGVDVSEVFTAVLKMGQENHEGKGATIEEAISNILPKAIKSMGSLSVTSGTKTAALTRYLRPMLIKRILFKKMYRLV